MIWARSNHKILLLVSDVLLLGISNISYLALYKQSFNYDHNALGSKNLLLYIFFSASLLFCFYRYRMYWYQTIFNKLHHSLKLLKSYIYSLIFISFIFFLLNIDFEFSNKKHFLILVILSFLDFFAFRVLLVPQIYSIFVKGGWIKKNMLIIGAGEYARKIYLSTKINKKTYYNIIGFIDDNKHIGSCIEDRIVLGNIDILQDICIKYKISDILIAINNLSHEDLLILIDKCKKAVNHIHIASKLYNIIPEKLEIEEIAGTYFFRVQSKSSLNTYLVLKRIIDIIISASILLLFIPAWVLIAMMIKITTNGPVLYKSSVIGKDEQQFIWYKFRSMRLNNDNTAHKKLIKEIIVNGKTGEKLTYDPRITAIGKFLRKFSLDEFPQVINVFKGEMSLVGPRPKLVYEYDLMEPWQKRRFSVLPGITGIWQIRGRNEVKFNDEIVMDLFYVENRSIKLDLEILIKTLPIVLLGKTGK